MAGESEVVQVQLTADGSRPVGLPEKFATVEDMVKSYTELEGSYTKLSQSTQETPPATPPAAKKTDEALPPQVASALELIGDFNVKQRAERQQNSVGIEGLTALEGYLSGDSIHPAVKAAYNAAVESGNEALIDANFAMVKQAFEAEHGTFEAPTNMVAGIAGAGVIIPSGTTVFRSLEEQLTAQRDPRYNTDTAFRKDVENRIAISGPYEA